MQKMKIMLVLCFFAATVQGGVVSLTNPGFEINPMADSGDFVALTGSVPAEGWSPNGTCYFIGEDRGEVTATPDGVAWMMIYHTGTSVGQAIGVPADVDGKTTRVEYLISRRNNQWDATDTKVSLIAGTSTSYTDAGAVELGSSIYNTPLTSMTEYNEASVNISVDLTGINLGANDTLWLVIENQVANSGDDIAQLMIDNVTGLILNAWPAVNVAPVDDAIDVPGGSVALDWDAGNDPESLIQGYLVYCEQTDHLGVVTTLADAEIVTPSTTTFYDVTVASDASCTWRVDTYLGDISDPNNLIPGEEWSFDTELSLPIIVTQPISSFVVVGEDAVFSVEATNPLDVDPEEINPDSLGFQWYADPNSIVEGDEVALPNGDARILGATTSELTIGNVVTSDGDFIYYCEISNPSTLETDRVSLEYGNLIAHYTFDGNANDSTSYANHGTWQGTETYDTTTQMVGTGAAVFDGSSYVDLDTSGAPNSNIGGLIEGSVSLWFKTTDTQEVAIAGSFNQTGSLGFQILINRLGDTKLFNIMIRDHDAEAYSYTFSLPEGEVIGDGQWHHLATTWGSSWLTYLDGKKYATTGNPGNVSNLVPWEYSMNIGARQNRETVDYHLTGSIDDYRLYDYALSGIEIAKLYVDVITDAEICLERPTYDLNDDCIVDINDLALFAADWLKCGLVPTCN